MLLFAAERIEEWETGMRNDPLERGTLGLAALLNRLGLEHEVDVGVPSVDLDDEADRDLTVPEPAPKPVDNPWASRVRKAAATHAIYRLADAGRELPVGEARLLARIAWHVCRSEYADVACMARSFLASDVGLTEDEGEVALKSLIEKEIIEHVPELDDERMVALRIVVVGLTTVDILKSLSCSASATSSSAATDPLRGCIDDRRDHLATTSSTSWAWRRSGASPARPPELVDLVGADRLVRDHATDERTSGPTMRPRSTTR